MNEELKIIIKAVSDGAKKSIQGVNKELQGLGKGSKSAGQSMMAFGKAAFKGAAIAVAAIGTAIAAIAKLGTATMEFREEQAKLQASFQSQGYAAQTASKVYKELFSIIGEEDTSVEAAQQIALFARSEKEAADMAALAAGVVGSFGDALKPETFFEAANETLKLNEATGAFVQMLEGKGVNVDAFNAKLQSLSTAEEKRQYIIDTSNQLMGEAGAIYRQQAEEIIAYRNSQTELNNAMAAAGKAAQPLNTALNNLSASFFNALTPALNAIIPALSRFIGWITTAVNAVVKFFSILSGGKSKVAEIGTAVASVGGGFDSAAGGANDLADSTGGAAKAAEKLKRSTAGFDELNKVADNSSGSSGGGSGGGGGGGLDNGEVIDTSAVGGALDETSGKIEAFIEKMKSYGESLKNVFQPTIDAWSTAFTSINWAGIGEAFMGGFEHIKNAFMTLGLYVGEEFIPQMVNSFSTNLAPVIADVFGFELEQAALDFQFLAGIVEDATANLIIPALDLLKTVSTDTFSMVGDNWEKFGGNFKAQAEKLRDGIRDIVGELYENIIKPVVENIINKATEIWTEIKPTIDKIIGTVLEIGTTLMEFFNRIVKPLVEKIVAFVAPAIKSAVDTIGNVVKTVIGTITKIISGVLDVVKGVLNFLMGVFTLDWKRCWEGIKQILGGIWNTIVAVVKAPINLVIDLINGLISGVVAGINGVIGVINKINFTVPDWVPGLGGKKMGFNLNTVSAPKIPKLATGGIVMSETLARIGEGGKKEAVLPLEQNTGWMDMLADRISQRNSAPSKIVLALDGKELGWASINSINNITKQTGNLPLVFA